MFFLVTFLVKDKDNWFVPQKGKVGYPKRTIDLSLNKDSWFVPQKGKVDYAKRAIDLS